MKSTRTSVYNRRKTASISQWASNLQRSALRSMACDSVDLECEVFLPWTSLGLLQAGGVYLRWDHVGISKLYLIGTYSNKKQHRRSVYPSGMRVSTLGSFTFTVGTLDTATASAKLRLWWMFGLFPAERHRCGQFFFIISFYSNFKTITKCFCTLGVDATARKLNTSCMFSAIPIYGYSIFVTTPSYVYALWHY